MANDPSDNRRRNPRFFGVKYGAGARVYDNVERALEFSGSGSLVSNTGTGQRWSMMIPLADERTGTLKRVLLAHQEMSQLGNSFLMAVPQDPEHSSQVPTSGVHIRVVEDAAEGATELKLKAQNAGDEYTLFPRWFFRFFEAVQDEDSHVKVYNFSIDQSVLLGNAPAQQQTVRIYPALTEAVPADTNIALYPFMRVVYARFFSPNELRLERNIVERVIMNVSEDY